MADCKLALLETSFSPDKIRMVIELSPLDGQVFDLPMEDAGKKLSSVANYARETFGVRSAPAGPSDPGSQGKTGPTIREDKNQKALNKLLKGGAGRAIKVLEGEVARARADKDPAAIQNAKLRLARALEMKAKNEALA